MHAVRACIFSFSAFQLFSARSFSDLRQNRPSLTYTHRVCAMRTATARACAQRAFTPLVRHHWGLMVFSKQIEFFDIGESNALEARAGSQQAATLGRGTATIKATRGEWMSRVGVTAAFGPILQEEGSGRHEK